VEERARTTGRPGESALGWTGCGDVVLATPRRVRSSSVARAIRIARVHPGGSQERSNRPLPERRQYIRLVAVLVTVPRTAPPTRRTQSVPLSDVAESETVPWSASSRG
jgi:hypothetical protein